jgi:hypothetical protein
MRRCGARIHLRRAVIVEETHRQAMSSDEPGAKEPDRPAAGDQDSLVSHGR